MVYLVRYAFSAATALNGGVTSGYEFEGMWKKTVMMMLRYCPSTYREIDSLNLGSRSSGRDSNPGLSQYKARVQTTRPRRSVVGFVAHSKNIIFNAVLRECKDCSETFHSYHTENTASAVMSIKASEVYKTAKDAFGKCVLHIGIYLSPRVLICAEGYHNILIPVLKFYIPAVLESRICILSLDFFCLRTGSVQDKVATRNSWVWFPSSKE